MTRGFELDLAFDPAPAGLIPEPGDPETLARLSTPAPWMADLSAWLTLLCADADLTCDPQVRSATALSLGLQFCDDATIATLNGTWRHTPQATDVISFAALDGDGPRPDAPFVELGDIIVSVDTARRQAREHGHGLVHELRWLVSHGLLHLLGWDHPDAAQLTAMLQCQERLLAISGKVQPSGEISCESTDGIAAAL